MIGLKSGGVIIREAKPEKAELERLNYWKQKDQAAQLMNETNQQSLFNKSIFLLEALHHLINIIFLFSMKSFTLKE